MTWQQRAHALLKNRGWSIAELARRLGTNYDALYKQLRSVDQPRGDVLKRMAGVLGVTEHWLRTGEGLAVASIPIEGYVSAGDAYITLGDHSGTLGSVDLDFGIQPIAAEVRGTSMLPVYKAGDRLIGDKQSTPTEVAQCVNRDCIIMTAQAEGYVKRLLKGSRTGLYTLRSHNSDFADIENVAVMWVAPIAWVRRG